MIREVNILIGPTEFLMKVLLLHSHIQSIPAYQTHYSRQQNPNRKYFDCDLNIASLYRDKYLDFCKEKNVSPVSEDKYRRIFNEKYNIGFKLPKSDTYKTCDIGLLHIKLTR